MMLAILPALAAQPAPADAAEFHAAIFHDLFLNAMIGNGNEEATLGWVSGHGRDHPPELRISNPHCHAWFGQRRCRFEVTRTPDPLSDEPAADAGEARRLRCQATFLRQGESGRRRWQVLHFPPNGGHSETSLQCRVSLPR